MPKVNPPIAKTFDFLQSVIPTLQNVGSILRIVNGRYILSNKRCQQKCLVMSILCQIVKNSR